MLLVSTITTTTTTLDLVITININQIITVMRMVMMWMWLQRSGLVDVSKWFICLKRIITHILGRWKSIVWVT